MVLATHFHDEIVSQALTSPLLIIAGLVVVGVGVLRLQRRWGWPILIVGVVLAAVGLFGRRAARP